MISVFIALSIYSECMRDSGVTTIHGHEHVDGSRTDSKV